MPSVDDTERARLRADQEAKMLAWWRSEPGTPDGFRLRKAYYAAIDANRQFDADRPPKETR